MSVKVVIRHLTGIAGNDVSYAKGIPSAIKRIREEQLAGAKMVPVERMEGRIFDADTGVMLRMMEADGNIINVEE